jgi:hypothetical protein
MTEDEGRAGARGRNVAPTVVGSLLILLGLVFLFGQELRIGIGFAWPFFVIVPGAVLLAVGLAVRGGVGLTIAGSIVTITGLLLLYQNATGHWESWAYAWALVAPGGVGVGMLLHGAMHGGGSDTRAGVSALTVGLGLFAAGVVFFEGLIGISGRRFPLPDWAWPLALVALGVLVLVRGLTRGRSSSA